MELVIDKFIGKDILSRIGIGHPKQKVNNHVLGQGGEEEK